MPSQTLNALTSTRNHNDVPSIESDVFVFHDTNTLPAVSRWLLRATNSFLRGVRRLRAGFFSSVGELRFVKWYTQYPANKAAMVPTTGTMATSAKSGGSCATMAATHTPRNSADARKKREGFTSARTNLVPLRCNLFHKSRVLCSHDDVQVTTTSQAPSSSCRVYSPPLWRTPSP